MRRYKELAKVRRELENMLVLVDELADRGVPKDIIIEMIKDAKADSKDERSGKEQ